MPYDEDDGDDDDNGDGPINRRTVLQLTLDELTRELDGIRERRLASVRKLEAAAKVKADMTQMYRFVAFNKKKEKILKMLGRLDDRMKSIEEECNKLRLLQFEIEA